MRTNSHASTGATRAAEQGEGLTFNASFQVAASIDDVWPFEMARWSIKRSYCKSSSDDATKSCDHAINKQNDNGANHGANKPRPLAWSIPTERLAQKRCNERSYDAQNGRENEASRLVISRHDELCDDAGYEANNDCP